MSENDHAGFLAGYCVNISSHLFANATEAFGPSGFLFNDRYAAAHRGSAFRHHHDGEFTAQGFTFLDLLEDLGDVVWMFGDQDNISGTCHTRVQGDPACITSHHFHHHYTPMRSGG